MPNLYQTLMFNSERHPAKVAVFEGSRTFTFAEFAKLARRQARQLRELGVMAGDRVAVMQHNSAEYLALFHASALGGFSIVPVNTRYGTAELLFLVQDCTPKVVLYEPEFQSAVDEVKSQLDASAQPHWLLRLPDDDGDDLTLGPVERRFGRVEDDHVAIIMYTSGTTSKPKGAMLTHGNLAWNSINYIVELGLDSNCHSLMATPLFHIGGIGVVNGPILYAGGSLTLIPRFDAEQVIETLERNRPTHLFLLSAMWVSLTDHPKFAEINMPHVTFVQTAASPLGEWRQELIRKAFPNAEFSWGFGMTETCVTTIKNRYTAEILSHPGALGYIWRHVQYRLVDEEGIPLADQRGPGELQIKGPTVFKGYWNQPELNAEVLKDGWLKTGDLIRLDDDAFAYFVGRSKDMIKTGGENVAALEVENCLAGHPDVREAAVFGLPHDYWGEELVAAVVPIADRQLDVEELRAHCRKNLSGFKVPKRIFILDQLPQSSSGKVQKFALKQQFTA